MARYFNGTTTHFKVGNASALHLPDGDWTLAPVWCVKVGAAAESKAQMDWWRCVQLR